ncbi:cubilin-like [Glandiceps talaboti]
MMKRNSACLLYAGLFLCVHGQGFFNADDCHFNLTQKNTNFTSPDYPNPYGANIDCTWNITVDEGSKINLVFTDFNVDVEGDVFEIYDETIAADKLIGTFERDNSTAESIIVLSTTNTLIVKLTSANKTAGLYRRRFKAFFNTEACGWDFSNARTKTFGPIYYLDGGPGEVTCIWTLSAMVGSKMSVTIDSQLKDDQLSILEDGEERAKYTGPGIYPDVISNGRNLTVSYVFTSSTGHPKLQASFLTISDCGNSNITLSESSMTTTIEPVRAGTLGSMLDCRWIITGPADTTLFGKFATLDIKDSNDYITILDGPTRGSSLIGQYSGSHTEAEAKALSPVLSTQNYLWIRFKTDEVVSYGNFKLSVNFQTMGRQYLHELPDQTFKINVTTDSLPTQYYSFSSASTYTDSSQNQVQLMFDKCNLTKVGSAVTFYDGDSELSPQLTQFTGPQSDCPTVYSNGPEMYVVVDGFKKGDSIKGTFNAIAPGCHGSYFDSSGTFSLSNERLKDSPMCSWTLKPTAEEGVVYVSFSQMKMNEGDELIVYDGETEKSPIIATMNSSLHRSPIIFSSNHSPGPMFVQYKKTQTVSTDDSLFLATYELHGGCQKTVALDDKHTNGKMMSPNFPNYYPFNAVCWHKLKNDDGDFMHLYFDTFNLYDKHQVQIINNTDRTPSEFGTYSGDVLPNDIVFKGSEVQVSFSSVVTDNADLTVNQGYQISYTLLDCGGNLTSKTGNFTTVGYPEPLTKSTTCIWIITIPPKDGKNVTIIDLKINFVDPKSENNYIEIRDGPSQRSDKIDLDQTQVGTTPQTILSRYNYLFVKYVYKADGNAGKGVPANFSYATHVCNATCKNNVCMHRAWVCDGIDQCGDMSDEQNCPGKVCPQQESKSVAGPVILAIVLTFIITIIIVIATPRVKTWYQTRKYSAMDSDVTERI